MSSLQGGKGLLSSSSKKQEKKGLSKNKTYSNKVSVFFIFGSCNIHVLHAQHLPLQKKTKKH